MRAYITYPEYGKDLDFVRLIDSKVSDIINESDISIISYVNGKDLVIILNGENSDDLMASVSFIENILGSDNWLDINFTKTPGIEASDIPLDSRITRKFCIDKEDIKDIPSLVNFMEDKIYFCDIIFALTSDDFMVHFVLTGYAEDVKSAEAMIEYELNAKDTGNYYVVC